MIIYKITNLKNDKIYIGKFSQKKHNFNQYWGGGKLIKKAIKKYGKNNFKKEIIQHCSNENELNQQEIFWIKNLNSKIPLGYNITDGGEGSFGKIMSNEQKIKISQNRKGKASGKDNFWYGKKISKEQINKMLNGIINKYPNGRKMDEETKNKISKANKGKKRSLEFCKKLSILKTGGTHTTSEKTKERLKLQNLGRVRLNSTKKQIAEKLSNRTDTKFSWLKKHFEILKVMNIKKIIKVKCLLCGIEISKRNYTGIPHLRRCIYSDFT